MPLDAITSGRTTLADAAYGKISEAMLTGELPPGTRLVMDTLAEQLGISRTPVRDALLRLEREGAIVPAGRQGYIVHELTLDEIEAIYQVREAVESFAARQVAEHGKAAIDRVAKVVEAQEGVDSGDPAAAYRANRDIHRAFVEVLDNPLLLEIFDSIWSRALALQSFHHFVEHATPQPSLCDEHTPLVDAARRGPDAARDAMIEHIRTGLAEHRRA